MKGTERDRREANRLKVRENHKRWCANNKERAKELVRHAILKQKYGISKDEYEELVVKQDGLCAICRKPPKQYISTHGARYRYLVVDHNHITGKIRGLLCHKCNIALGSLGDDLELFEKAVSYVRRSYESTC